MGRPKGCKDRVKRKRKNFLNSQSERQLIQDYQDGVAPYVIRQKYNITKGALSTLLKNRNIKTRINRSDVSKWQIIKDVEKLDKNVSGIYAMLFELKTDKDFNFWNSKNAFEINNIKVYVGSSVCIRTRIKDHLLQLKTEKHYNQKLKEYAYNEKYIMKLAIIEQCKEEELLQKEGEALRSIGDLSLINKNGIIHKDEVGPWLEKAASNSCYLNGYYYDKNKSYNGSLCKCSTTVSKRGYSQIKVNIQGKTKHFTKHRVAYWEKHNKYPELIRHMCGNSVCYNPEHLAEGSCRANNLDKRGDFPKEFEKVWVDNQGDLLKISEYYSDKWARNQMWKGHKVSYAVYSWEKKLKLNIKYPEIIKARRNRATPKV